MPLAFWQSSHEHMNIESTLPEKRTVTAPHAQRASMSTIGRGLRSMGRSVAPVTIAPQARRTGLILIEGATTPR